MGLIAILGATGWLAQSKRLDWGLGNPNTTASLISLLILAAWFLHEVLKDQRRAWLRHVGFWGALALSLSLSVPLVQTASRGGIVAMLAGAAVMATFSKRPWRRDRVASVVAALMFFGFLAAASPKGGRLSPAYSVEDASVLKRLEMWKSVPSMLADAPGGWGTGKSPKAFSAWYQAADWRNEYLNLLSSHFTWLAEFGWLGRLAYMAAWGLAIRLAWPDHVRIGQEGSAKRRLSALPLALLISLFVGACFSAVAGVWQLWLLPLVGLLVMMVVRFRAKAPGTPKSWMLAASVPCVVLLVYIGAFRGRSGLSVLREGDSVVLGHGAPRMLVVLGEGTKESARRLRSDISAAELESRLVWTKEPERFADENYPVVVLLGHPKPEQTRRAVECARKVLLLAPQYAPEELFTPEQLKKVTAYVGEFSASEYGDAWRATGRAETLTGMADFIGDWTERLRAAFDAEKKDNA